jgi:ankyrin repeat protein
MLGNAVQNAAYKGNYECLQIMLDKGAKIQNKDKDGSTCVHYAAFGGNKQCLKLILKKIKKGKEGLSVSSVDRNKQ